MQASSLGLSQNLSVSLTNHHYIPVQAHFPLLYTEQHLLGHVVVLFVLVVLLANLPQHHQPRVSGGTRMYLRRCRGGSWGWCPTCARGAMRQGCWRMAWPAWRTGWYGGYVSHLQDLVGEGSKDLLWLGRGGPRAGRQQEWPQSVRPKLDIRKFSFSQRVITRWNMLPDTAWSQWRRWWWVGWWGGGWLSDCWVRASWRVSCCLITEYPTWMRSLVRLTLLWSTMQESHKFSLQSLHLLVTWECSSYSWCGLSWGYGGICPTPRLWASRLTISPRGFKLSGFIHLSLWLRGRRGLLV